VKLIPGLTLSLGLAAPLAIGCGSDPLPPLFEPQPECEGAAVEPFAGDHQNLISFLEIGSAMDGFDLDGDGDPDNKLAAVGSLAREPIETAIAEYDIMIPVEFFDLPTVGDDECVKFGIYLGVYKFDNDEDGRNTAVEEGDCNDLDGAVRPGVDEVPGNRIDDDCDGLADEVLDGSGNQVPPDDAMDLDLDGVTLGEGDCNDDMKTGMTISPEADEVCGDGLDNDCDGVADRGTGGETCDPYDGTANTLAIDPLSFEEDGSPVIAFTNGTISGGVLTAGPSLFQVSVPVIDGLDLDLRITGAQIISDIEMAGDSVRLSNARLGGVIDAQTADNIRGLEVPEINLTPENSLLDAIFANLLGTLLALPYGPDGSPYVDCQSPDIDVDRDGLEIFCDSDPDNDPKAVDMCIDGDGTVIMDSAGMECTDAVDASGKPRFVDGISVELNFQTQPAILAQPN
jgi:hypothetical protein